LTESAKPIRGEGVSEAVGVAVDSPESGTARPIGTVGVAVGVFVGVAVFVGVLVKVGAS
jgi:hypothetical protein